MEHGRMGGVRVTAIDRTRGDNAHGRGMLEHGADLDRRRVGSQQPVFVDEKGILHVTGGMILGEIERLEIIVVELHFGTFGNLKAETGKNFRYLSLYERYGVPAAELAGGARQRHVDSLFTSFGFPDFANGLRAAANLLSFPANWSLTLLTTWPISGRSSRRSAPRPFMMASAPPSCRDTLPGDREYPSPPWHSKVLPLHRATFL